MKLGLILERVDYLHQTHLYFKVFSLKLLSSDQVVEGRGRVRWFHMGVTIVMLENTF